MNTTNQEPQGDIQLSPHFKLSEFTRSATALDKYIDNTPGEEEIENLRQLCENILDPIRLRFGVTRITSGFRNPELNSSVGGAINSQHMRGEAADIHISNPTTGWKIYEFVFENLDFDQMLFEKKERYNAYWIHLSYTTRRQNRHDARKIVIE